MWKTFDVYQKMRNKISQFLTGLVERLRTRKIVWHKKVTKNGDFTWVKIVTLRSNPKSPDSQKYQWGTFPWQTTPAKYCNPRNYKFLPKFLETDSQGIRSNFFIMRFTSLTESSNLFWLRKISTGKKFSELSLNINNLSHIYQLDNISICYVYGTDS